MAVGTGLVETLSRNSEVETLRDVEQNVESAQRWQLSLQNNWELSQFEEEDYEGIEPIDA